MVAFRITQFLAAILTALALVPGGAHFAAMANKMALGQSEYFIVQQIYAGWALFGIVLFAALFANLAHAIMLTRSRGFAFATVALIAANLAIFFVWTFPANQATNNWKTVPENWEALRIQWEYSHAVNAVVMFAALACVTVAVLRQRLS